MNTPPPLITTRAATWTVLIEVTATKEIVSVGSWTDPTAAARYGKDAWFQGRATYRGVAPLIQPNDLIRCLGGNQ